MWLILFDSTIWLRLFGFTKKHFYITSKLLSPLKIEKHHNTPVFWQLRNIVIRNLANFKRQCSSPKRSTELMPEFECRFMFFMSVIGNVLGFTLKILEFLWCRMKTTNTGQISSDQIAILEYWEYASVYLHNTVTWGSLKCLLIFRFRVVEIVAQNNEYEFCNSRYFSNKWTKLSPS